MEFYAFLIKLQQYYEKSTFWELKSRNTIEKWKFIVLKI